MRSRERRAAARAVLLSMCTGAALVACASEQGSRSGALRADSGWTEGPRAPASATAPLPLERWDLAEELRRVQPATQRARSQHAGGDLDGEVLATPASGYPLRGPTSLAPVGSTLVERLFVAAGSDPAAYFVMIKRPAGYDPAGGDWEYLVVLPDGRIEERGKLPLCARCHAEAPHDRLFGGGR